MTGNLAKAAAVLWTLVVIAGHLWPGQDLPESPFDHFDLLIHVGMFAPLASLWFGVAGVRRIAPYVLILLGSGLALECLQEIPGLHRSFSLADLAADALGIAVGILLIRSRRRPGPD